MKKAVALFSVLLSATTVNSQAQTQEKLSPQLEEANLRMQALVEQRNEQADRAAVLLAEVRKMGKTIEELEKAAKSCTPAAVKTK